MPSPEQFRNTFLQLGIGVFIAIGIFNIILWELIQYIWRHFSITIF